MEVFKMNCRIIVKVNGVLKFWRDPPPHFQTYLSINDYSPIYINKLDTSHYWHFSRLSTPSPFQRGSYPQWFMIKKRFNAQDMTFFLTSAVHSFILKCLFIGAEKFHAAIEDMLDKKISRVCIHIWKLVTPSVILVCMNSQSLFGFVLFQQTKT